MTLSVESTTPVSRACDRCSAQTVAGTRYEATQTVSVRLCLRCGWEWPKFGPCCDTVYARPHWRRFCAYESCRKEVSNKRFCSAEHYALSKVVARVTFTCPCGVQSSVRRSQSLTGRGVYCSIECRNLYRKRRAA